MDFSNLKIMASKTRLYNIKYSSKTHLDSIQIQEAHRRIQSHMNKIFNKNQLLKRSAAFIEDFNCTTL